MDIKALKIIADLIPMNPNFREEMPERVGF
jgi:hypothetical protein